MWKTFTDVGKEIELLKGSTDFEKIKVLSTLSAEEKNRLIYLKDHLSKNLSIVCAEKKSKIENIKKLRIEIKNITECALDQNFSRINLLYSDAISKRNAAQIAAEKIFHTQPLEGIGSQAWHLLFESARQYAKEIAYQDSHSHRLLRMLFASFVDKT